MSNGKANTSKTIIDEVVKLNKDRAKAFGIARQVKGVKTNISLGTSGSKGGGDASNQPNFVKTSGDTMMGAIAFSRKDIEITSNTIDISKATGTGYSSYVTAVDGLLASEVDLETIEGAEFSGQLLYLETIAGQTIVLKHNVDNIIIPDAVDFDLTERSIAVLIFDTTWTPSGKWVLVSTFTRGGGANTTLSNLVHPTAINQDLLPGTTDTEFLGSATKRWLISFIKSVIANEVNVTKNISFEDDGNGPPTGSQPQIKRSGNKLYAISCGKLISFCDIGRLVEFEPTNLFIILNDDVTYQGEPTNIAIELTVV